MFFTKARKQEQTPELNTTAQSAAPVTVEEGDEKQMTLIDANPGSTYTVRAISTEDHDLKSFLFRLGCYEGEPITLLSKKSTGCVVVIKDGRCNLDVNLSKAVLV